MVDLLCQLNELRFLENHAHMTWLIIALLFALLLLFLLVLWDDFKRWNTISVIVQLIIEMCMLWLMEDCIISHFNHPVQGDYSKSAKFENSWLAFFKCLKKVNSTLQNKGMKFLLIQLKKPPIKLLAYLDRGKQQNCNKNMCNAFFINRIYSRMQKHLIEQLYFIHNYLLKVKGRSMNDIHFTIGKYLLILLTIMLFYLC